MTAKDLYSIGARLLAIYFVVIGLASLPGAFVVYDAAVHGGNPQPELHLAAAISYSAVLVVFGAAILYLKKFDAASVGGLSAERGLRVGVQLLGLFFAASGFVGVIDAMGEALVISSSWSLQLTQFVSPTICLVVGLAFLLLAAPIAQRLGNAA